MDIRIFTIKHICKLVLWVWADDILIFYGNKFIVISVLFDEPVYFLIKNNEQPSNRVARYQKRDVIPAVL